MCVGGGEGGGGRGACVCVRLVTKMVSYRKRYAFWQSSCHDFRHWDVSLTGLVPTLPYSSDT